MVYPTPELVYDGGCPFCSHFAQLCELRSGIDGLRVRDGRADQSLRHSLRERGFDLSEGAVLIDGDRVLHGPAAIHWLCARMEPSAPLLKILALLFGGSGRAAATYPLLLLARRAALAFKGLPVDPDR